ncbi:hypothetical protein BRC64_04265 [Halobacteriales archaeon QH_10_67_22]|nr:MAG: hypothetical protein BRC64_04265 [Halobacteriales archaeon QH_10_67_22]
MSVPGPSGPAGTDRAVFPRNRDTVRIRESVEAGADLLGGLDPASHNEDMTRTLDAWFDLATDLDVDLVVHDSLSRQWAIVEGNQPRVVIKDGTVVARDGELVA